MMIANFLIWCGMSVVTAAVWNYDWRLGLACLGLITIGLGILVAVRK